MFTETEVESKPISGCFSFSSSGTEFPIAAARNAHNLIVLIHPSVPHHGSRPCQLVAWTGISFIDVWSIDHTNECGMITVLERKTSTVCGVCVCDGVCVCC